MDAISILAAACSDSAAQNIGEGAYDYEDQEYPGGGDFENDEDDDYYNEDDEGMAGDCGNSPNSAGGSNYVFDSLSSPREHRRTTSRGTWTHEEVGLTLYL